jgi:hypothetical protein
VVVVFTTTRAEEEGAKALWIVLVTTAGIVGPAGSTNPKPTPTHRAGDALSRALVIVQPV